MIMEAKIKELLIEKANDHIRTVWELAYHMDLHREPPFSADEYRYYFQNGELEFITACRISRAELLLVARIWDRDLKFTVETMVYKLNLYLHRAYYKPERMVRFRRQCRKRNAIVERIVRELL